MISKKLVLFWTIYCGFIFIPTFLVWMVALTGLSDLVVKPNTVIRLEGAVQLGVFGFAFFVSMLTYIRKIEALNLLKLSLFFILGWFIAFEVIVFHFIDPNPVGSFGRSVAGALYLLLPVCFMIWKTRNKNQVAF